MIRQAAGVREGKAAGPQVRVLWLAKGLGAGGAERVILLSARHRDRAGVTGRVAYLLPQKVALVADVRAEGIDTVCVGTRVSVDPRWVLRLRRELREHPVDVVHVHAPVPAVGARLAVRSLPQSSRPVVVTTFHSVWRSKHRLTRALDRMTARLDAVEFAVSEAVRSSMPASIRDRCEVLVHGVDVDEVRAAAVGARDEVRAELGIGLDEVVVVTAANLRRQKAYPDLIAAARIVVERNPQVRFVTLGQGQLAEEIAVLHRASGLGERFLLLGYRDDAVRIVAAADVACLSSITEGYPLALVEAAVLGVPAVATCVGGVPEVVVDGETGILVAPARPDLLAAALLALAEDPERRHRLGEEAQRQGARLSIARSIARYEAAYRELVSRRLEAP